jgi:hypothetical protein
MEETAHRAILVVHCEDISNFNNGAIQSAIIIPCCILPRCKTYTAPIRSIAVHGVACKFVSHEGAQTQMKTDTHIIPVDYQNVSTPKRMQFTTAPITIGQKTDKNNPLHDESEAALFVLCLVVL